MVFIKRYKKTAAQNPRGQGTNYNRILGDAEVMVTAFEGEQSVRYEKFGHRDIIVPTYMIQLY